MVYFNTIFIIDFSNLLILVVSLKLLKTDSIFANYLKGDA